ncbi:MAG: hypothetical protein AAFR17_09170 [Pseudomonadota bacterium]
MTRAAPLQVLTHKTAPVSLMRAKGRDLVCRLAGLNPKQVDTLAAAPRVQGRLTAWLTEARGFPRPAAEPDTVLLFAPELLDRAIVFAGAALASPALTQVVTREARAALRVWLPEKALGFALEMRGQAQPPWRWDGIEEQRLLMDGRAAAYAWTETLEPGDLLRLSLRWPLPRVAPDHVFDAGQSVSAAALFRRAVTVAAKGL